METANVTSDSRLVCKEEIQILATPVFEWGNTSVQIVRRNNGTDNVVAEFATEYLVGSFFALLAVCLLICAMYISLVFYIKWRQKRSLLSALQTVKEECDELNMLKV